MSLTKWFRKNNKKIFVTVTVIVLFGFIGGSALMQSVQRSRVVTEATYGQGKEITNLDLHEANQELEILASLAADRYLLSRGFGGLLLSQLLFGEGRPNPNVVSYLLNIVSANQLNLSETDLAEVFDRPYPPAYYWILLHRESAQAGLAVATDQVKQLLTAMLPQVGGDYGTVMRNVVSRYRVPEERILSLFGQLLSVMDYALNVCSLENVSSVEIQQQAHLNNQPLDVNWVEMDATEFAKLLDPNDQPGEEAIRQQFDRFKNTPAGLVDEENPFGFGYRLPDRIQLDYLTVRLEDVVASLDPPSAEEAERYYQRNAKTLFTLQEDLDPNDPDAGQRDRTQAFSEVADQINVILTAEAAIGKAEQILQAARSEADADLLALSEEQRDDEAVVREKSKDYARIAEKLSQQFGVTVRAGQTGLLSRSEFNKDGLARLNLYDRGSTPVSLADLLFQVDPIGRPRLHLLGVTPPKLYESLGPAKHQRLQEGRQINGQTMALVRVIRVAPAASPASVETVYDNTLSSVEPSLTRTNVSIREQVISDLRTVAAFDLTRQKAEELRAAVVADGWQAALAQFNQTYGPQVRRSASADPNVLRIGSRTQLTALGPERLAFLAQRAQTDPTVLPAYQRFVSERHMAQRLYELFEDPAVTKLETQVVLEAPAQRKVFLVKDVSVPSYNEADFAQAKARIASEQDVRRMQRLLAAHFSPSQIMARTRFELRRAPANDHDVTDGNESTTD